MSKDERTFNRRRAAVLQAVATVDALQSQLRVKYGESCWASRTERRRLDTLQQRLRDRERAMFALIEELSPRDWSYCIPYTYSTRRVSFADVVTRGLLSEIPPIAWGGSLEDNQRFAEALR